MGLWGKKRSVQIKQKSTEIIFLFSFWFKPEMEKDLPAGLTYYFRKYLSKMHVECIYLCSCKTCERSMMWASFECLENESRAVWLTAPSLAPAVHVFCWREENTFKHRLFQLHHSPVFCLVHVFFPLSLWWRDLVNFFYRLSRNPETKQHLHFLHQNVESFL